MPFSILAFTVFMFIAILPASNSVAASSGSFYTDDSALWTTTDTNSTISAATTTVTTTDSLSTQGSQTLGGTNYPVLRYGYDELDRLSWVQYEDGTVISYSYDKVGNRITKNTTTSAFSSYTITVTNAGSGTVVPSGTIIAPDGSNKRFLFEPNDGASILSLSIDGTNYPLSTTTHIFNNLSANHTINVTFSTTCTALPVRREGSPPEYFGIIQNACNTSSSGDVIKLKSGNFIENVNTNLNTAITLRGGYDACFSNITGQSLIKGTLTISNGTVVIDGLTIGI